MSTVDEAVEYRDIPGFPGYRVGDDGSVWSCRRRGNRSRAALPMNDAWHRLSPGRLARGYQQVVLCGASGVARVLVHRLVLEAFVGPSGGMQGCHCDGNPENNRAGNLRWDTPKANGADRVTHGTLSMGERHPNSKLNMETVRRMRELHAAGWKYEAIAKTVGVSRTTAARAIKGLGWKCA